MVMSCCCLIPPLLSRGCMMELMNAWMCFPIPDSAKSPLEKFFVLATPANVMSDTVAFLDWLGGKSLMLRPGPTRGPWVLHGRGSMSLTAAGTFPDRMAATAR